MRLDQRKHTHMHTCTHARTHTHTHFTNSTHTHTHTHFTNSIPKHSLMPHTPFLMQRTLSPLCVYFCVSVCARLRPAISFCSSLLFVFVYTLLLCVSCFVNVCVGLCVCAVGEVCV